MLKESSGGILAAICTVSASKSGAFGIGVSVAGKPDIDAKSILMLPSVDSYSIGMSKKEAGMALSPDIFGK